MGKPLNGKARMTPKEREERRKELDRNPFHKALTRRTRNSWYARNKDRINAKRRLSYASNEEIREKILSAQRERRKNHDKEKASRYSRLYYLKNKKHIIAREKIRSQRPDVKAKHDAILARRKERFHTDPVFREKVRAQKREQWKRRKYRESYRRSVLKNHFIPYWKMVVEGGPDRIATYMRFAKFENRKAFVKWYTIEFGLLDMTSPTVSDNPNMAEDEQD